MGWHCLATNVCFQGESYLPWVKSRHGVNTSCIDALCLCFLINFLQKWNAGAPKMSSANAVICNRLWYFHRARVVIFSLVKSKFFIGQVWPFFHRHGVIICFHRSGVAIFSYVLGVDISQLRDDHLSTGPRWSFFHWSWVVTFSLVRGRNFFHRSEVAMLSQVRWSF